MNNKLNSQLKNKALLVNLLIILLKESQGKVNFYIDNNKCLSRKAN